jgi:hypothetical protein
MSIFIKLEGMTIDQGLHAVYGFLGTKYRESDFMGFIRQRRRKGWIITEKKGVYKVTGIVPVS